MTFFFDRYMLDSETRSMLRKALDGYFATGGDDLMRSTLFI